TFATDALDPIESLTSPLKGLFRRAVKFITAAVIHGVYARVTWRLSPPVRTLRSMTILQHRMRVKLIVVVGIHSTMPTRFARRTLAGAVFATMLGNARGIMCIRIASMLLEGADIAC